MNNNNGKKKKEEKKKEKREEVGGVGDVTMVCSPMSLEIVI